MGNRSIIPFGPQHPVLPEPIHLDLVIEDEKVVQAIPNIGFIHRGLEKLVQKRDFTDYGYVVERICGICSYIHGMSYYEVIEHIMGIEVPERAKYLRTIWSEMSRIHSHLLWLGLLADGFGFEALFYQCWRLREKVLDMFEASTGGRVVFSVNTIGGVLKDMDSSMLKSFVDIFQDMDKEIHKCCDTFLKDYTVETRLKDVGILTKENAVLLGAVGPTMRGSGIAVDTRKKFSYAAYDKLDFEPCVANEGDSFARCAVRIDEVYQSIDLIRQAVDKIPAGEIITPYKGKPNGEFMFRAEQPRGEAIYYGKANGTNHLERFRIRTPTFANITPLLNILAGCQLADVPILVLTIDPCISCTER